MLNKQKIQYDEYRILPGDGTETKVSKAECFASGEKPTRDNPYRQRWYYSPDRKLAIRLPRNEEGERMYQKNEADLKGIERSTARQGECVGQHDKKMCPVTCSRCPFINSCRLPDRDNGGCGCTKKCEECLVRVSRFRSLDKPVGADDNGDPIFLDYASGEDIEDSYIKQEEDREYTEAVERMVPTLDDDELHLLGCLLKQMSIGEIMAEFGISEYEVKARKKALREKFTMKWLRKNHEHEEMVKGLISTLSPDELLLYRCIRNKMQVTKIAERLGVHRKTAEYRREKLRRKFIAAGLEEYF